MCENIVAKCTLKWFWKKGSLKTTRGHRSALHLLLVGSLDRLLLSTVGSGLVPELDLGIDLLLSLVVGESGNGVLLGDSLPVLRLLGGLEGGVLSDGGVSIGVDLLDVLGSDTVGEVGGELLLESEGRRKG